MMPCHDYQFACLLDGCDTIVDYFNISKFFVKLFEFFLFINKIENIIIFILFYCVACEA